MDNRFTPPTANLDGPTTATASNNSGGGKGVIPPEGIKGWSWGAFLMNWIWGISNKTFVSLWCFVPIVGAFMSIYLGIKGRELAWRNKRWDSVEHFQRVQRKWSVWSGAFMGVCILLAAVAGFMGANADR